MKSRNSLGKQNQEKVATVTATLTTVTTTSTTVTTTSTTVIKALFETK